MHYDHPVKDSDYDQDQKLPFVSHASPLICGFTINPFRFSLYRKVYSPIEIKNSFIKVLYNKEILNSIWQPPRFINLNLFSQSFFD
jgi:hypothetical protein